MLSMRSGMVLASPALAPFNMASMAFLGPVSEVPGLKCDIPLILVPFFSGPTLRLSPLFGKQEMFLLVIFSAFGAGESIKILFMFVF